MTVASGPAYSRPAKAVATLFVAALVASAARDAGGAFVGWPAAAQASAALIAIAVGLGYYWILASRTSVDATHLVQTWLWPKRVALADIAHARLLRLPGFDWIVAPRLVVHVRGRGPAIVFPAASPDVLREFARLDAASAAR